jgi:hypothetical protein
MIKEMLEFVGVVAIAIIGFCIVYIILWELFTHFPIYMPV